MKRLDQEETLFNELVLTFILKDFVCSAAPAQADFSARGSEKRSPRSLKQQVQTSLTDRCRSEAERPSRKHTLPQDDHSRKMITAPNRQTPNLNLVNWDHYKSSFSLCSESKINFTGSCTLKCSKMSLLKIL